MSEQDETPHVIALAGLASASAASGPESREPIPDEEGED